MTWLFGVGGATCLVIIGSVGYWFGVRAGLWAALVLAFLFVIWRTVVSFDLEAELGESKAALASAQSAFEQYRTDTERAAEEAAARIRALDAARAAVEIQLSDARAQTQAALAAAQTRIRAHVPARPQCDYPQPVLDGLRDAWTAADGRREGPGTR